MADIRIVPASSIMSFTSSLNYIEKITQDASGSLNLFGSGSTGRTELLSIDGNNGRLFTVSDDLSDSLFSVNTIAGLPVIEAFANNSVNIGQYSAPPIKVTGSQAIITGSLSGTASYATTAGSVGSISANVANNTNNYILTATGGSTVNGEDTLTYNGSTLSIVGGKALISTDGTYGTGYGSIGFGGLTNGYNRIFGSAGTSDGMYICSSTGRGIFFRVNGGTTSNMVIDSAGRVGIGTTTPGYTLDNQGSTRLKGQVYGSTAPSSGQTGGIMSLNQSEPGTGGYNVYYFYSVSDSDTDSFGRASINVDAENGATISAYNLGYTTGGNITVLPGGITLSTLGTGFLNINTSRNYISKGGLDYNNGVGTSEVNGEIAYWGGGSVTAGNLYYYDSSGNWTAANASAASTATNMLGIAKATGTASTVGMLLRGHARFTGNSNYTTPTTVGAPLYVKTTAGGFAQSPPNTSGQIVRIIGYVQSTANDQIYFCPDTTWVELA